MGQFNDTIKPNQNQRQSGHSRHSVSERPDVKACKIIVIGNEKGGSGKSTTAMHVAISLLRLGKRIGTIDLDARQGTLTRYLTNRFSYITRSHIDLASPHHMAIEKSIKEDNEERRFEEASFLDMALHELGQISDYIVIDTPGTDTYLNRLAHKKANTLITPINDSFVDLDVLARVDQDTHAVIAPSFYTNMVMELQSRRKRAGEAPIDWIVMRNRLSALDSRNKKNIFSILSQLENKFHFRQAMGFGERVIFRELFLKGLTLMDLKDDFKFKMTMSELAARQEVRNLIASLDVSLVANQNKAV